MTYKEAAQSALGVQDACNLSGVVVSFQEAMMAVWDEALRIGEGTKWVNEHPIVCLFLDKLLAMSNFEYRPYDTYERVKAIAEAV